MRADYELETAGANRNIEPRKLDKETFKEIQDLESTISV